jgi:hypothetical protein
MVDMLPTCIHDNKVKAHINTFVDYASRQRVNYNFIHFLWGPSTLDNGQILTETCHVLTFNDILNLVGGWLLKYVGFLYDPPHDANL